MSIINERTKNLEILKDVQILMVDNEYEGQDLYTFLLESYGAKVTKIDSIQLAAGAEITKHVSSRNATINVMEGRGVLMLDDQEIILEAGVFAFIPANAGHAIKAVTNFTFLLTLFEQTGDL